MHRAGQFLAAHRNTLISLLTAAGFIVVWELVVRWLQPDPLFMVPPTAILEALLELIKHDVLQKQLLISAQLFFAAFLVALVAGIVVGMVNGWYATLYASMDLLMTALYVTPLIILLPLFIIWFGLGAPSQFAIVFVAAFFPVVFNTAAGVRAVDPQLIRVGRAFGATDFSIFRDIALPSSVPYILASLRISLGRALTGLIFAEWFAGRGGIGYLVANFGQTFQTANLFAMIMLVVGVSLVLVEIIKYAENKYASWIGVADVRVTE